MKYTTLLANAVTEKDVENAYRQEFAKHWTDADITSPYGTDGLIKTGEIRLLCEMKLDQKMKNRIEAMNILAQLVFYLKKFQKAGEELPQVLFAGDKDECFVLSASSVMSYLDMDIDWSVAPSAKHPRLAMALVADTEIAPFIYDVNSKVDFSDVIKQVEGIAKGKRPQVRATPENIERLYGIWESRIFKESVKDFPPVKRVTAFLKCLFYPGDVYMHPKKKNILRVNRGSGISTKIDAHAYRGFFSNFHQGYSPSEIDKLYEVQDRILEDSTRRFEGAFYTPPVWIKQAHSMLDAELGADWRQTHLVIDVACGVANLTRDYQFNNLILSTLNQEDVDVIKEQGYNHGATVECWDFLRSPIPKSIEVKLIEAEEKGIPVVFISNPPYGSAGSGKGKHKAGATKTMVVKSMKYAKMGASASQQLYAQFMFQVNAATESYGLNSVIGFFNIPKYSTGAGYGQFGDYWERRWEYRDGALFPAGDFAGTSERWGIEFSTWRSK